MEKLTRYGRLWVSRIGCSYMTIRSCGGLATRDENTNACEICVALNKTAYKIINKPEYRHPNCRCRYEIAGNIAVTLDFPKKKITGYMFVNPSKAKLIRSMGYLPEDADELYRTIAEYAIAKYEKGDYVLGKLDKYGQKINISVKCRGKREKEGRTYDFYTGWTVYPNGELKNNTPFARWEK